MLYVSYPLPHMIAISGRALERNFILEQNIIRISASWLRASLRFSYLELLGRRCMELMSFEA